VDNKLHPIMRELGSLSERIKTMGGEGAGFDASSNP
jgi:hypothetical protein